MKKIIYAFTIMLITGCWSDTQTQMIICAANDDSECIKNFLENGENPNGHGKENGSPFYAALKNHNFSTADIFLKFNIDLNGTTGGKTFIEQAVIDNDYDVLIYLKNAGCDLKKNSSEYELALSKKNGRIIELFN